MHKTTIPLLLVSLLLAGSAAQAQTALIAHRSHGGTGRTFRPAATGVDNFGLPTRRLVTKKIVWLRDATAVRYDQWVSFIGGKDLGLPLQTDTLNLRQITGEANLNAAFKQLRELYPAVKLVGFDSKEFREAAAAQ